MISAPDRAVLAAAVERALALNGGGARPGETAPRDLGPFAGPFQVITSTDVAIAVPAAAERRSEREKRPERPTCDGFFANSRGLRRGCSARHLLPLVRRFLPLALPVSPKKAPAPHRAAYFQISSVSKRCGRTSVARGLSASVFPACLMSTWPPTGPFVEKVTE